VEPVRIKLYGLVSMTRRGYLIQLTIGLALLAALAGLATYMPPLPNLAEEGKPQTLYVTVSLWVLRHLPWIVLTVAVLFALEAVIVLRRFARAESRERERLAKASPQQ